MDCCDCERLKRELMDASVDLANAQSVLNGKSGAVADPRSHFIASRDRRDLAHQALVDHLTTHEKV